MRNPLLKFVMREKKTDVVHTSAFGKAQNGQGMGATSVQSFSERMEVERNRKRVRSYSDSRVVAQAYGAVGVRAKEYILPEKNEKAGTEAIGSLRADGPRRFEAPKRPGISK